ncbi:uncharacterized protein V1518DRAFT_408386 [Limtongia smithiae]|uniref:uncharacterized protein n=1 Tax=Limtongia smithiae TaxID=1125753 RepID=UPI0034CDA932
MAAQVSETAPDVRAQPAPLSEVSSYDSRRNSPSTMDHRRALQNLNGMSDEPSGVKASSQRPRQSMLSFWHDKEKETQAENHPATSPGMGSPIMGNRVKNSVFHQASSPVSPASTFAARTLPASPVKPLNFLRPRENSLESTEERLSPPMSGRRSPEKRSSILSTTGSLRLKKVTFEMAPPQVLEFESTTEPVHAGPAMSDSEDDGGYSPIEVRQDELPSQAPTSPMPKFESAFSSGSFIRRSPSGSRSLPRPSMTLHSRPLPALPVKPLAQSPIPAEPQSPQPPASRRLSARSAHHRESEFSVVSDTGSTFDAMDILDDYAMDDISETAESESGHDDSVANTGHNEFSNKVTQDTVHELDVEDSQRKKPKFDEVKAAPDHFEEALAKNANETLNPKDVLQKTEHWESPKYVETYESPAAEIQTPSPNLADEVKVTEDSTVADLIAEAEQFKLELPFESKQEVGLGLDDYLTSSSFLTRDWSQHTIQDFINDTAETESFEEELIKNDVPEPEQTIKSSTGARTRPSLAPAEFDQMAREHRKVSGDYYKPTFLELPEAEKLSLDLNFDIDDLTLEMEQEFDRVVETQKRGYLMRQNTNVVYARAVSDFFEKPPPPPVPPPELPVLSSEQMSQTAPVNQDANVVKARRRDSSKVGHLNTNDSTNRSGVAPTRDVAVSSMVLDQPLIVRKKTPKLVSSQAKRVVSNGSKIGVASRISENFMREQVDPADRGRLFVKVLALKDLKIDIVEESKPFFTLTLDNGIHCVTTAHASLTNNAAIYQEFELIVGNGLEFILTLKAKITQPCVRPTSRAQSPKKKDARFGLDKLFGSPKRRSINMALEQASASAASSNGGRSLESIMGPDGSFARSYISFSDIEREIRMKSKILEVPCYSEWANDPNSSGSPRKQKTAVAPFPVGKIVLQMLFFEKEYKSQEIPRSLNACLRVISDKDEN